MFSAFFLSEPSIICREAGWPWIPKLFLKIASGIELRIEQKPESNRLEPRGILYRRDAGEFRPRRATTNHNIPAARTPK